MPVTSTDSLMLKNIALLELVASHVVIGFYKDAKWVGGKLSLIKGLGDKGGDPERPMLWKRSTCSPSLW